MINKDKFRCTFLPIFYQKFLSNVDSIIHLDSETIITGNLANLWGQLSGMNDKQMVAIVYHRQPINDKYKNLDSIEFKDIRHFISKRINANVAVMNLTRLRKLRYLETTLDLFDSNIKTLKELNYQQLVKMLFFYNREIFRILPCHMNFLAQDCEKGFFCKTAFDDAQGLQLINGNSLRFMENQVFYPINKFYSLFNVSNPNASYKNDLMEPIQRAFSNITNRANNQCYGNVNKVIFKQPKGWLNNLLSYRV